MQVQGYQKKSLPELLKAIDSCTSIGQLCALVQHEHIVIQMKSQQSASNIPRTDLPQNPNLSPLESLRAQVRQAAITAAQQHTKEELIRTIELCPSIDKLFELVKRERIVIQMKAQHGASCLPQKKLSADDFDMSISPLDKLKEQVKSAVMYGG